MASEGAAEAAAAAGETPIPDSPGVEEAISALTQRVIGLEVRTNELAQAAGLTVQQAQQAFE